MPTDLVEGSYGTFIRSIPLPKEVKSEKIKAVYRDGVLTITLPKVVEAEKRDVKVKIE